MSQTIVFATNNQHKLTELRQLTAGKINIMSLNDIGCNDDIPEDCDTLEGNAIEKARWVKDKYGYDCFADDTGLEVEVLDGRPGVHSARYASPSHDSAANMKKLLEELKNKKNRKARFRTVIALIYDTKQYLFEGIVEGHIATEAHGDNGFGYDPIFYPELSDKTFAEMSSETKNSMSHRGRAVSKLIEFLSSL